ncbi:MAG: type I restriction-modification system subunit M [Erysipelotrichaceae bacterium]|nr:type I restriction-modification system subunit M [Erysipelotrichaceae bacterium]
MNKQQLATKIWESANNLRSKIEANEYKDYILGFIFYKFVSDKEVKFLKENDFTEEDIQLIQEDDKETVDFLQSRIGYFISYDNLFSTWLKMGSDFDVSNVRDALSAFSRLVSPSHKKVFEGIFQTLETGLSKLGTNAKEQTKAISDLIYLIKDIPMDGKQDYDVLGYIYEYLISNFASNAGKKAGEFYTPHEVSLLMSDIIAEHLKDRNEIKIYDPCSGSGSLLITIGKSVSKHLEDRDSIKYYAQELKENTYNLTRMNLVMRGIKPDNIVVRNGDTLEEDWPYFDDTDPSGTYDPLYVDAVTSNPPYSQKWSPSGKDTDERFAEYGLAPKGKADYAFLLHDLYHVKPNGIMTIVLPHGVLFRGGEEGEIRKKLIEKNKIDAIIGLPANIFFGTGIPTIIMVLKPRKDNDDVLIIDASKGFTKEGKNNKLRSCDIKKITDAIKERKDIDKYCKVVSRDEIRNNDYNLNIPRYVDSSEKSESWDIYASMFGGIPTSEINEYETVWKVFPSLKNQLFEKVNDSYCKLNLSNIKLAIQNNEEVKDFINKYNLSFANLNSYLTNELIENAENVSISKEEEILSKYIFDRLENIPLVDKYEVYELLDESWNKMTIDLEMIQTEGFRSVKLVDPNMIVKKKNDKETEVQDGWIGHIIPFEIAQKTFLKKELNSLNNHESRLSEIDSELDEIVESLSEEEKEMDFFDSEKNVIIASVISKTLKDNDLEQETKQKLKQYQNLQTEKKQLNKTIKTEHESLQMQTKQIIESLTDEQAKEALNTKWIQPFVSSLNDLPKNIINNLTSHIEALSKKYDVTFSDLEKEIKETEKALIDLTNELTGSEYDMLGLNELKAILGGSNNE